MSTNKRIELPTGFRIAVLPLRDIVVFPFMVVSLFAGREKSVRALEATMRDDQRILLLTQKDPTHEDPTNNELFTVGTIAKILNLVKLPDGTVKVMVEGESRAYIKKLILDSEYYEADIEVIKSNNKITAEIEALVRTVQNQFEQYAKLNSKVPPEVINSINKISHPDRLADAIAGHLTLKVIEKQKLLAIHQAIDRLEEMCAIMENELNVLQAEKRIRNRVKSQMERSQRDYYLNEQIKAIQKELGETSDGNNEIEELENRIKKTKLTKEARTKAESELRKFKVMNQMSSEAAVIRNYLDWLLAIPWNKPTKIKIDLIQALKTLDADHYGLDKVKERIIEYLSVQARVGQVKGPILCLVGPPGVGKTSLGQSIAKATGRQFVRMALGGVKDESEIRGHRRTYIGSMPGKIIQSMKKVDSSNPLMLLDEIDKLGQDWRGDPSSALLEVLDPEQNMAFSDHYLEVDYNLSDVMFVTTANSLNMPQPLLDRMEIIRLAGYTESEKIEIAKQHLFSKQLKRHGLKPEELSISDEALKMIVRLYTREAGVRSLERELTKIMRKVTKQLMTTELKSVAISKDNLKSYLGIHKHHYGVVEKEDLVGVTTALAWTEAGGDILFIEALSLPGKGKVTTTGKLGEVMQESIQAAASYVRSKSVNYGIEPPIFEKQDIHVHVPEGATPKDGPSAGVAMMTSIVSILTGIAVRKDVAMTGEITLRGRVLAIGGLKEKLLAALRAGIRIVLIPAENENDLEEIPEEAKQGLKIIPVNNADEVLMHALVKQPISIIWQPPQESQSTGKISAH